MRIDIWSDVVCPWCAVGRARVQQALARFPHRDEVQVVWRSFELDASAPAELAEGLDEHLAAKYRVPLAEARAMQQRMTEVAATDGLEFRFDRARSGNTFAAHRLLHAALEHGVQDAVKDRFFRAYLTEGEPVGDPEVLVRLAAEAGLPEDAGRAALADPATAEAVRADEREAAALGIRGVPFLVVDRRYALSGAQPADTVLQVLERAWAEAHPLTVVGAAGGGDGDGACGPDGCAVPA